MILETLKAMAQSRAAVQLSKLIEECEGYAEEGMRARVIKVDVEDEDVFCVTLDFSDFDEYNRQFESSNYYDKAGSPTLTAREAGQYKQQEDYCFGLDALEQLQLVPEARTNLLARWRNEAPTKSYVEWLEDVVISQVQL